MDSLSPSGDHVRQLLQSTAKQVDDKTFEHIQDTIEEDLQVDPTERNVLIDGLVHNKFKRSQIPQVAAYIAESLRETGEPAPGGLSPQRPLALKAKLEEMGVKLQPLNGGLQWHQEELAVAVDVLSHFPPALLSGVSLALSDGTPAGVPTSPGPVSAAQVAVRAQPEALRQAILQGAAYMAAAHLSAEQRQAIAGFAFQDLRDIKEQSPQTYAAEYQYLTGGAAPNVLLTPYHQNEQDPEAYRQWQLRVAQRVLMAATTAPQELARFPRLAKVAGQLLQD